MHELQKITFFLHKKNERLNDGLKQPSRLLLQLHVPLNYSMSYSIPYRLFHLRRLDILFYQLIHSFDKKKRKKEAAQRHTLSHTAGHFMIMLTIILSDYQQCLVSLKERYGFGNCQRPVFSLGVSQHKHKITNLWKFGLNWSSKLRENDERKKPTLLDEFVCFVRGIKDFKLEVF